MNSWKVFAFFTVSIVALALAGAVIIQQQGDKPKLTTVGRGYVYEHVPYPPCPNDMKRTVEIPEKDEVDALTIRCEEK